MHAASGLCATIRTLRYGALWQFDRAMIHLFSENAIMAERPVQLYVDEVRKVLIFARGCFIFALNFHPSESVAGFTFRAPAGEYRQVLDTDAPAFGGYGRNDETVAHFTVRDKDGCDTLSVYLPSRSAIVLKRK